MKPNLPLRSLHPASALLMSAAFFAVAMFWRNPLWLALLLLALTVTRSAARPEGGWAAALLFSLPIALAYAAVNAVFSQRGETMLWTGPSLPVIGRLSVSLEAAAFGAAAGLTIAAAVSVFSLAAETVNPDDAPAMVARVFPKSALTLVLTVLLIPRMRRDLARIRQVMSARGVPCNAPGLLGKIRSARPLMNVLLLSSLEGSWDLASALDCRAFGSGRRSLYMPRRWRVRDTIVSFSSAAALAAAAAGLSRGAGSFSFYPRLSPLITAGGATALQGAVLLLLMSAWTLNLVMSRWPSLKSII